MPTEYIDGHPDRCEEWFEGKTIFITGGSGFMGKVLIEKLLRACPKIKKIIMLIRDKKGKTPEQRLKEIFDGPLFDKLKAEYGADHVKKVVACKGDVAAEELAISKEDRAWLCEEVQIVFHCAATIRFDETLKKAVLLNVRGTKLMLDLAREMKNLMVFVHLSTAYCHLNERVLYEKPYPPPASPHHVIKCCEWMSEEVLETITPKLLGNIPNTYAFTKALGEALVCDEMDNLPVVILRPSIVLPIWLEPIPGWTDNINGPTGLLIGAGKGVIRTMWCNGDGYADYVPVDIAVNCMIASTYDYVHFKGVRRIYNVTSSAEYKISYEEIIEIGRKIVETKIPLNGVAWYPGGSMKKSKLYHNICFFLYHLVPALFVDALLILLGYKPVLMRVQRRISKGFEVFEYYANNQWDFHNEDSMEARKLMNPTEKKKYRLDGDGIDYEEYFTNCIHAARLYILKETDDQLPAARRHMKVMWCVDKFCKTMIICGFMYLIYKYLLLPIFT
ncbi:hypothetical protein HHI36_021382 [Cryptolaemus montrouzieri]